MRPAPRCGEGLQSRRAADERRMRQLPLLRLRDPEWAGGGGEGGMLGVPEGLNVSRVSGIYTHDSRYGMQSWRQRSRV